MSRKNRTSEPGSDLSARLLDCAAWTYFCPHGSRPSAIGHQQHTRSSTTIKWLHVVPRYDAPIGYSSPSTAPNSLLLGNCRRRSQLHVYPATITGTQHRCDYWNYEDVSAPTAHSWPACFVVHMPNVGRSWPLRIRNRSSDTPDPPPREASLCIRTVSNTDAAGGTARHFGQGGCLCDHHPRI